MIPPISNEINLLFVITYPSINVNRSRCWSNGRALDSFGARWRRCHGWVV